VSDSQREFFRIDDQLRLRWQVVDPSAPQSANDRETELRDLNEALHNMISTAFGVSAVMGEALGLLNRKIELLTETEDSPMLDLASVPVNLSGSGLAFCSKTSAEAGQLIDLTMLLLPTNATVQIRAVVVTCSPCEEPNWPYWIRSSFEPGQEFVTEQIVQHVNLRQVQSLSSRHPR